MLVSNWSSWVIYILLFGYLYFVWWVFIVLLWIILESLLLADFHTERCLFIVAVVGSTMFSWSNVAVPIIIYFVVNG